MPGAGESESIRVTSSRGRVATATLHVFVLYMHREPWQIAEFFPKRALRLRVSSTYFRFMGQSAYASLAARLQAMGKEERGKFYDVVAEDFRLLEEVLRATRSPRSRLGCLPAVSDRSAVIKHSPQEVAFLRASCYPRLRE